MMTRFRAISETETFARIEYIHHSRITETVATSEGRKAQEEEATDDDDDGTRGPLPHSSKRRSSINLYMRTEIVLVIIYCIT